MFLIQGLKVIIYILLLPLANVLLSIIIVAFSWGMVQGRGIVDPSNICHGERVAENEVRLQITSLQPSESYHPLTNKLIEIGS